ncbi:ABC transporter permease [Nocardia sp. NBC_01009]|uniref:ABC transporter permease n=1 Tax=Nocardia sp. NBC_01009 TaxID=2975996 RepID=UPI003864A12C|nr:ABC transporter permease [Nocardia sp. NBC_01009]
MSTAALVGPTVAAGGAAAKTPRTSVWRIRLIQVASVAAVIGLWQLLTANNVRFWLRFDTLPTVTDIIAEFGQQFQKNQYYVDIAQSLIRILTGFGLAAVIGVLAGIGLGRSGLLAAVFGPLTELARPIPAIALVPVAILLFPSDESGIVFITFTASLFPVLVSTRHAVRALPTIWEDALRTLGASRTDVLVRVAFPGILPGVFSGLSVGMGVAWICLISAEMISGRLGIGYRTWQAYTIVDYPAVFVGMITIGILGFGTSGLVELAGRRITRWLPREASQ